MQNEKKYFIEFINPNYNLYVSLNGKSAVNLTVKCNDIEFIKFVDLNIRKQKQLFIMISFFKS